MENIHIYQPHKLKSKRILMLMVPGIVFTILMAAFAFIAYEPPHSANNKTPSAVLGEQK